MPLSPDDRKRLASLSELLDTHRREPILQAAELADSLQNQPLTVVFHRALVKSVTTMLMSPEAQKNLDAAALVADLDRALSGALERAAAPVIVKKLSGTGAEFKVGLKMLRSARPQRLLQSWWRTCTPYGHSITLTPSAFHRFLPKYHEAVFDAMLCGLPDKALTPIRHLRYHTLFKGHHLQGPRKSVSRLTGLISLDISNCGRGLPDWVGALTALKQLNVSGTFTQELPDGINALKALTVLRARGCPLQTLPEVVAGLTALEVLDLSASKLTTLPDIFAPLKNLKQVNLDRCQLTALPPSIALLPSGCQLNLNNNHRLTMLPAALWARTDISLTVHGCRNLAPAPQPDPLEDIDSLSGMSAADIQEVADILTERLAAPLRQTRATVVDHLNRLDDERLWDATHEALSSRLHRMLRYGGEIDEGSALLARLSRPTLLDEVWGDCGTSLDAPLPPTLQFIYSRAHRWTLLMALPQSRRQDITALCLSQFAPDDLANLWEGLARLPALTTLRIRGLHLKALPDGIERLSQLTELHLEEVSLQQPIPSGLTRLTNLQMLSIVRSPPANDPPLSIDFSLHPLTALSWVHIEQSRTVGLISRLSELSGLRQLSSVMSQSPDPLDADALRQRLGSSNVIVIQEREEPWSGEER